MTTLYVVLAIKDIGVYSVDVDAVAVYTNQQDAEDEVLARNDHGHGDLPSFYWQAVPSYDGCATDGFDRENVIHTHTAAECKAMGEENGTGICYAPEDHHPYIRSRNADF